MYKFLIRPLLFLMDPEKAHNLVLNFFSKAGLLMPLVKFLYSPKKKKELIFRDLKFRNNIGLSAGFDKNAVAFRLWDAIGFSHAEVGTVTPFPQPGNPKPRIFRLKKDYALINRLGFNNKGADEIFQNISKAKRYLSSDFIIGVNIGKNKDTPMESAFRDYKICFEKLFDVADYFTLNISSPNTADLRTLHEDEQLSELLGEIQDLNKDISQKKNSKPKLVFLKISPDIDKDSAEIIYKNVRKHNIDGIIATNTTISRGGLISGADEQGGLSGKPLKFKSDEILSIFNELNNKEPGDTKPILIGCGGIFNAEDMKTKLENGASLIQIYTGMIYEGPGLIKNLHN